MSEPKRLLDSGSALERTLLESGQFEKPSKELQARVRAAMLAGSLAAPVAATPAAPKAVSGIFAKLTLTRGIIAVVAALAVGGAIVASMHRAPVASKPAPALAPAPAPSPAPSPAPVAEEKREVTVTPDSLPTAPAAATATPSAKPATSAVAPSASSIEREVELLDVVKSKLGSGATAEAARALDAYDAEFPTGALRPEGTVLRIRTLLLQGNRAAANALAEDFLQKHPGSVHAKRIRALLAD